LLLLGNQKGEYAKGVEIMLNELTSISQHFQGFVHLPSALLSSVVFPSIHLAIFFFEATISAHLFPKNRHFHQFLYYYFIIKGINKTG
jgi:hypothetical protein